MYIGKQASVRRVDGDTVGWGARRRGGGSGTVLAGATYEVTIRKRIGKARASRRRVRYLQLHVVAQVVWVW